MKKVSCNFLRMSTRTLVQKISPLAARAIPENEQNNAGV